MSLNILARFTILSSSALYEWKVECRMLSTQGHATLKTQVRPRILPPATPNWDVSPTLAKRLPAAHFRTQLISDASARV